jgi:hypothetical protein
MKLNQRSQFSMLYAHGRYFRLTNFTCSDRIPELTRGEVGKHHRQSRIEQILGQAFVCHFRPENRTGGVTREAGRAVSRPVGSGDRKGADPIVIREPGAHCSMRLAVVDDAVYQMKEGTILSGQY